MNNYIDLIILGILGLSVIVSLLRGFIREVMSLITWIAGFFIASNFYIYLADNLRDIDNPYFRNGAAIAILFFATLILGGLVNYLLGQLVDKTGLTGTDRVLGACFGLLRGVLIVSALLFFADTFTTMAQTEMWQKSQLIPHFGFVVEWFFHQVQANSSLINQLPKPM